MIISKPIVITTAAIIVYVVVLYVIKYRKQEALPDITILKKIYACYIPSTLGAVPCEINFTTNKVSTLTAGYGITEEIPLESGNVLSDNFSCDFKEIVRDKSRVLEFEKKDNDFNITFIKSTGERVSSVFSPYKIHDISNMYRILEEKSNDQPTPVHNSSNNTIYVGYIGISEENQKNILFIDIDYENNNIYTITNQRNPIKGTYTGDLNSNFQVRFTSSFLGDNRGLEFKRLDYNTYDVKLLDGRLTFPMEVLNMLDISKLYSILVFEGALGLEFKKKARMRRGAAVGRKMIWGFPKMNRQNESIKFMELYKNTKMVQLDFQNSIKILEHNKKNLESLLQKNK